MSEAQLLLMTAASIAFLHTLVGADHYLPFVAMGKARGWGLAKTLRVTFYCGLGHVMSSVLLGIAGLLLGAQLASLVQIEGVRGSLAGWALLAFGLVYFAWGMKRAGRDHTHSHTHSHGDLVHSHPHQHDTEHAHVHDEVAKTSVTPWALFVIFVLGPCEALIPLLMYPAAQQSGSLVVSVALLFGLVTLATMLSAVALASVGLRRIRVPAIGRYSHAVAGAAVVVCGAAISFVGL